MKKIAMRIGAQGWVCGVIAVLSACGGGDGAPPPTPLPDSLAITSPRTAESATTVAFGNSVGALDGLRYRWDFGDGATSAEAAPSHSFASGGDFDVVLRVSNQAGLTREARTTVSITNLANARGLECTGAGSTGWCWQHPRPMRNPVYAMHFRNASTGWAGGGGGEIFKTTDGGASWVRQRAGGAEAILAIQFLDASRGWALTSGSAVLRTTDAGANWESSGAIAPVGNFPALVPEYLPTITAVDARNVYVSFMSSFTFGLMPLYRSTDGGVSWQSAGGEAYAWPANDSPVPRITATGKFWRIKEKVDSSNLLIGKEYGVGVSLDGGLGYSVVLSVAVPAGYDEFVAKPELIVRGDREAAVITRARRADGATVVTIYTTADGGTSWSQVVSGDGRRPNSISANGRTLLSFDGQLTWISTNGGASWVADPSLPKTASFQSLGGSSVAACVGAGASAGELSLQLSDDDGRTWAESGRLRSCDNLRRVDARTLVRGKGSSVELSQDNGRTWTLVDPTAGTARIAFADARTGFRDGGGASFTTRDGGLGWTPWRHGFGVLGSLQFVGKSKGWLVAGDGQLYASTDAGQTWARVAMAEPRQFQEVFFQSEVLGWGRTGSSDNLWTRDGGKTWSPLSLHKRLISLFQGSQVWVAGALDGLHVSTDSGATWLLADTPKNGSWTLGLAFSDANTAWAVGNGLIKSEDGGRRWAAVELPALPPGAVLRAVKFVNAKVGWIIGDQGFILATRDGGQTWRQQASGTTEGLSLIEAVDANTAWVVTARGAVLVTGNGGQ